MNDSSPTGCAHTTSCSWCFSHHARNGDHQEQLLLYANDLRHLLEIERRQRALLQAAYHDTVAALAYWSAEAIVTKYLKSPGPLVRA